MKPSIPVLPVLVFSILTQQLPAQSVADDSLVRLPGTQPGQVSLEAPGRCFNCHSGYNTEVEPGFNWMGSMMAQSARDFLFWSCLTVAAQDSMWALNGSPNAVDLCERCHFPKGWLEGRSDPPNASLMSGADYDGVQCDFCHRMYDPFFQSTYDGRREGDDWLNDWDETNASSSSSQGAADQAYLEDAAQAQSVKLFNGSDFLNSSHEPFSPQFTENASGQFFVSAGSEKRASFADAAARHQMVYSRYHKSKYFCGTCHDVSNPVLANLGADTTQPLPTESNSAFSYFHVERTFSEFMSSAYGLPGGAPGLGPFAPDQFNTSRANNYIGKCQDCHMRDVRGKGANKKGVPVRPDQSVEHPESGQPLHDLTGGNAWVSYVLASALPGSPNPDEINASLLGQGPATLTLDLTQGQGLDPVAILAGAERAKQQLQLAASIQNLTLNSGTVSFRIQNQTGHKLISGFPEGRRMFVNIKAYDAGSLVWEINPYDLEAGTFKVESAEDAETYLSDLVAPRVMTAGEEHEDDLVYEMHPSSSLTNEEETFHFVLADGRYKDNRIPPKGFRLEEAEARLCLPVRDGETYSGYFSADEYAGGYDEVSISLPVVADGVEVSLFYQTTSREYVEFLRNEINGTVKTLPDSAYVAQTDPFFDGLRAWGDTIWDLWVHNKDVPGAAPFLMASNSVGNVPAPCVTPTPSLDNAVPAHSEVTLNWSGAAGFHYRVYYDQAGKAQFIAETADTSLVDTGLTNGQQYCYKVTAVGTCESAFSNVLCAIPSSHGQLSAGVSQLETGLWVRSGKGKNATLEFVPTSHFSPGDTVVLRASVVDRDTGLPLADATVNLSIEGPESAKISSQPSDGSGIADAEWRTQAPGKRNQPGTAPGTYTALVTNVLANGYHWDTRATAITFAVQ